MPLYLAFLWHMHQPYYADTVSRRAILPWTRLHASKNYLRMAQLLQEFPQVKATFNLVPSLLEQIQGYIQGSLTDRLLELGETPLWSVGEEDFILEMGFHAPLDFIGNHLRYRELWERHQGKEPLREAEVLDLLVLFHLAWIDEVRPERDPLRHLLEKGRNYTRQDLKLILEAQRKILEQVIPTYRAMEERGQIELTTSPYFHPILPLLVDSSSAQEASPNLALPNPRFAHLQDAQEQVLRAVKFHQQQFGRPPRGLWPSEGAVGQGMLSSVAGQVAWIASDEGILARSLGILPPPRDEQGFPIAVSDLYQPYALNCVPALEIIFRDRFLSDLISFEYAKWDGQKAAADLVQRLHSITSRLPPDQPHLVAIILDGENPWESYPENGNAFLRHLYAILSEDQEIQTITPSQYLQRFPPQRKIQRLATGSWIEGNLEIWIGEPTHNRAWEALAKAREALLAYAAENRQDSVRLEPAWRDLHIAEGSDWFWWYSPRNPSPQAPLFDGTFRTHLGNVYRRLGLAIPESLLAPIA